MRFRRVSIFLVASEGVWIKTMVSSFSSVCICFLYQGKGYVVVINICSHSHV